MALRILELAARLLLALGVGCILLGGYLSTRTLVFAGDAKRATGEVVSYREVKDGDKSLQRPRVRFETETGEIVTTDGQFFTAAKRFSIGQQVPVVYKTTKPMEARIDLFLDNWIGPTIAAVVGFAGVAGGLLVRRSVRREMAKSRP
jgi:hypothetical protein